MLCRETVDVNGDITAINCDVFFKQSAGKADKGYDRLTGYVDNRGHFYGCIYRSGKHQTDALNYYGIK